MKHIQRGFALLAASLLCTTPLSAGVATSAYPNANHPDDGGETYIDDSRATKASAEEDLTINYPYPEWSEIPIVLTNDEDKHFYWAEGRLRFTSKGEGTLTATITTEKPATFVYEFVTTTDEAYFTVYIDDKEVRTVTGIQCNDGMYYANRFFEELTPGKHTIRLVFNMENVNFNAYSYSAVGVLGAIASPAIEVSLLEPGSLGTEVLYNVDHLLDVRNLKVKGAMNETDWGHIKMMKNLCVLDLSEAQTTEVPAHAFENRSHPFLHRVVLPEGVKSIGANAFNHSFIEEINFPSTLESIGSYAFSTTAIKSAMLHDATLDLGERIFNYCASLKEASLPNKLTKIPDALFHYCHTLTDCPLPTNLENIGNYAFKACYKYSPALPESLTSIGNDAFMLSGIKEAHLGNTHVTSIGNGAFSECDSLASVELPSCYSVIPNGAYFNACPKLETIVLKSPTVVQGNTNASLEQITLRVPDYLVNAYKLDNYWYNCKSIEGFSTAEVKEWTISQPLVLSARDRFEGCPDVNIVGQGSLKVNGIRKMELGDVYYETNGNNVAQTAQLWSNCDSISIVGALDAGYYVTRNSWYFISLPFNFRPADIAVPEGAQYALRRYDGGARAANGAGQSWTNVEKDETVTAGTGFIFQASQDGWYRFRAMDDASKQYIAANKEFAKALAANPSDVAADRGWNLVGNPYQTYYNVHRLNFTAPITLWNAGNRTYEAYSIIDDDVALQPGQAFFVQCPDEVESISFPLEGRQLTADIESQTATRPMGPGHDGTQRLLLDLSLGCGDMADRTRVVLNDAAEETYETACDAAKFMSDATDVPQLYSLGADGTRYAINERPAADGTVRLGFRAGSDGSYTLRLTRHEGCHAWLTDLKTGTTADLTEADYHFTAEAGTDETRFVLAVEPDATTGIGSATTTETLGATATQGGIALTGRGTATVYGADGRKLGTYDVQGQRTVNVPAGIYVVSTPQGSVKVTVNR